MKDVLLHNMFLWGTQIYHPPIDILTSLMQQLFRNSIEELSCDCVVETTPIPLISIGLPSEFSNVIMHC